MEIDCNGQQELCSVYRGDSINYDVEFKWDDGAPIDITGMTLWFTAKLNHNSKDGTDGDIQVKHVFPESVDSVAGIGTVVVSSTQTRSLVPGRHMHYDFQLVDGENVTTVGSGQFLVLQDITLSV